MPHGRCGGTGDLLQDAPRGYKRVTKFPVKITDEMVDKDKMGVAINFLPIWTPRKAAME